MASQPVPHGALRCRLSSRVEPSETVASPSHATSPSSRHNSLSERIGIGQVLSQDRVPHCNQFSRREVLGQVDVQASTGRHPDSVN